MNILILHPGNPGAYIPGTSTAAAIIFSQKMNEKVLRHMYSLIIGTTKPATPTIHLADNMKLISGVADGL